ncbi:MAG: hypothetical protein HFH60_13000 [Lachnospiraceae bacterium]|nr:hypothetical protein [Lachnospiraceae bacterium]
MRKFDMTVSQASYLGSIIREAAGSLLKMNSSGGCDTEAIRRLIDVSDFLEGRDQSSGSSTCKNFSAESGSSQ